MRYQVQLSLAFIVYIDELGKSEHVRKESEHDGTHICNPTAWQADTGGLRVQSQPRLYPGPVSRKESFGEEIRRVIR